MILAVCELIVNKVGYFNAVVHSEAGAASASVHVLVKQVLFIGAVEKRGLSAGCGALMHVILGVNVRQQKVVD